MSRVRAFHVLALTLLIAPALNRPARAQIDRAYAPAAEAHGAGRWSLQFSIADNFQLGSFAGTGLSITKNTSPHTAWELGFSYDAFTIDQSSERLDPVLSPLDLDRQDDALGLGVTLFRLHRYQPDRRVGLQFGVGPALRYSHQHSEIDDQQPTLSRHVELKSTQYGVGVGAALGTEVFLTTALSVQARYNGSVTYTHGTSSLEQTDVDTSGGPAVASTQTEERTFHGWSVTGQGVTFGLSVYF